MRDLSGMSPSAQQAVKNIQGGDTPYQQRRAFNRKAAVAGLMAAGTGLSGLMKKDESDTATRKAEEREEVKKRLANRDAVNAAIKNATRPPSAPDDTIRDEYGLPVEALTKAKSAPSFTGDMDRAVNMGRPGKIPSYSGAMDASVRGGALGAAESASDAAKNALKNSLSVDASLKVPHAGQWTPDGMEEAESNSDVQANDIRTGQNLMEEAKMKRPGFGGLGNSFGGGY